MARGGDVLHPPQPLRRQRRVEEGDVRRFAAPDRDRRRHGEGDAHADRRGFRRLHRRDGRRRRAGRFPAGNARGAAAAGGAIGSAEASGGGGRSPVSGRDSTRSAARTGTSGRGTVIGRVERLPEGRGVAGNQRKAHAVPVRAGAVLHHRPALQARLAVALRHHQAPGRLPQRRAGDVGEADLARRRRRRAAASRSCARPRCATPPPLPPRDRGARRAPRPPAAPRRLPAGARCAGPSRVSTEMRTPPPPSPSSSAPASRPVGAAHRHALAAERPEQRGAALEILRPERQAAEGLALEVLRRQPHAFRHARRVAQQQALQHVVHALHRHAERDRLVGRAARRRAPSAPGRRWRASRRGQAVLRPSRADQGRARRGWEDAWYIPSIGRATNSCLRARHLGYSSNGRGAMVGWRTRHSPPCAPGAAGSAEAKRASEGGDGSSPSGRLRVALTLPRSIVITRLRGDSLKVAHCSAEHTSDRRNVLADTPPPRAHLADARPVPTRRRPRPDVAPGRTAARSGSSSPGRPAAPRIS